MRCKPYGTSVNSNFSKKKQKVKIKTQTFKNPKRTFVKTIGGGGGFQENFLKRLPALCRMSIVSNVSLPLGRMLTKKALKFQFTKFPKIPHAVSSFVRTIGKEIQEKF